jgi:hypothetical protein
VKISRIFTVILLTAALPTARALAGGVTDVPEHTGLHQLAPETSLFLLEEFKFPADEKAIVYRTTDGYVRVDYFVSGRRVGRGEIPQGATYCSVMSHAGVLSFSETSKRLQVSSVGAPNPAPRDGEQGVGVELRSVQSTRIASISCYQPNYATQPLTVNDLRQVIRMKEDDSAIAFLGPPQAGPVLAEVVPPNAPNDSARAAAFEAPAPEPRVVMAHIPSHPTVKTYQSLKHAHEQYVKLLKQQAAISAPPSTLASP